MAKRIKGAPDRVIKYVLVGEDHLTKMVNTATKALDKLNRAMEKHAKLKKIS